MAQEILKVPAHLVEPCLISHEIMVHLQDCTRIIGVGRIDATTLTVRNQSGSSFVVHVRKV